MCNTNDNNKNVNKLDFIKNYSEKQGMSKIIYKLKTDYLSLERLATNLITIIRFYNS